MDQIPFYIAHCPQCSGRTQFSQVYQGAGLNGNYSYRAAAECVICGMLVVGADRAGYFSSSSSNMLVGKDFPEVPPKIASAASEAHRSMQADCLRGAAILARAAIEATAKDKGITSGTVAAKIEQMFEKGLIREYVREGADEVRHFGNDMAHGDFPDEIDPEDVRLALELMDEVLEEVYQAPARVKQARERRARAKLGEADTDPAEAPQNGQRGPVRSGIEVTGRTPDRP